MFELWEGIERKRETMYECKRKECDPACNLRESRVALNYAAMCIDKLEELDDLLTNSDDERMIRF